MNNKYTVDMQETIDRVTAERDALQAELAGERRRLGTCINQIEELQQRLTAADERADHWRDIASEATCRAAGLNERADVLEGLLRNIWHIVPNGYKSEIDVALKPAEGGGNE